MTETESGETKNRPGAQDRMAAVRLWFGSLAKWQKGFLAAASLLLVLGVVAMALEGAGPSEGRQSAQGTGATSQSTQSTGGPGGPSSLVSGPGQPESPGAKDPKKNASEPGADPWSAGFFRLGFSFFAGFAIGMALRTFLRLAVIGSGIALLFLFLLSYGDLISVNWTAIDSLFENFGKRISEESGRFQSFITGSLPSTGLAALGLATAVRRGST